MKYKRLTPEQITKALNEKDYETLYQGFFPLIKKEADKYTKLAVTENYRCSTDELFNDYISAGMNGLYKAVEAFKPDKGTPFLPYLQIAVRSEMIRFFKREYRNQYNITPKCDSLQLINNEADEFEMKIDELMVEPDELQSDTNIQKDVIIKLIKKVTKKDRDVEMFLCYFGIDGREQMTYQQLGKQNNITTEAARQVVTKILTKLQDNKEILKAII